VCGGGCLEKQLDSTESVFSAKRQRLFKNGDQHPVLL